MIVEEERLRPPSLNWAKPLSSRTERLGLTHMEPNVIVLKSDIIGKWYRERLPHAP